jgi:hypothetical protein
VTSEFYAELRKEYPQVSEGFWDLMGKRDALYEELNALRGGIAELIGYHDADGAVPVAKLRTLLRP